MAESIHSAVSQLDLARPINLASAEFVENKYSHYEQIRQERPVGQDRISLLKVYTVARYDDCAALLKDPRIVRNRSTATGGGGRSPIPLPKSIALIAQSMITEDDPNHKRLRDLVRKAFRPQAISHLEQRIDAYSNELLNNIDSGDVVELQQNYALQIPTRLIADMMGLDNSQMPEFQNSLRVLSEGLSGWRIIRTLLMDMPRCIRFVRELIQEKRSNPGEDILTGLIQAEEDGDKLSEDEVVAMVFLLIFAGYETTVHLITNGTLTLLQHPDQLALLRDNPSLIDSAVEEILRHRGPVHSTKPGYATEDIMIRGVSIPKGKPIMPLFGAANHDPEVFDDPLRFDITRSPNHHLGFGHGVHYCLGAHLARAEAKLAILNMFQRFPNLQLAVPESSLVLQKLPGWHRYSSLPLQTG